MLTPICNRMKKYQIKLLAIYLLSVFFSLKISFVYSQTYLEPILGYGFSKNIGFSDNEYVGIDIPVNNFNSRNLLLGAAVTSYITNNISFKIIGQNSKNFVGYSGRGIVGFTDMKFKKFNVSLTPILHIFKNIEIGVGINYNRLYNFEIGKELKQGYYWSKLNIPINQNQIGWVTSLSYNYKSILMSLQYFDSYSVRAEIHHYIKRTGLIELSLTYRLKIFDEFRINRKNTQCPKIKK